MRPCPPESTTPASFSTGSISGVFASTSSPYATTFSSIVMRSSSVTESSVMRSAMPFATVRIVPSFGFITALYAVSTARLKARAMIRLSIPASSACSRISFVKPRINWLRITPELPRAPRREPLAIAFATFSRVGASIAATSRAADMMVMVMFVPVSPSGTGNTFNSLIHSFFAFKLFAPARNAFFSCKASI